MIFPSFEKFNQLAAEFISYGAESSKGESEFDVDDELLFGNDTTAITTTAITTRAIQVLKWIFIYTYLDSYNLREKRKFELLNNQTLSKMQLCYVRFASNT